MYKKATSSIFEILVLVPLLLCSILSATQNTQGAPSRKYKSDPGILNTFRNLTRWANNEKVLYTSVKALVESRHIGNTHHEAYLLTNAYNFIQDFEGSTLKHLQGLKNGKDINSSILSVNNYDELVASSLILVYRMTHRFAKYGEALQDFVSESLESEENPSSCSLRGQQFFKERWPGSPENDMVIMTLLSTYEMRDIFVNPHNFVKDLCTESETPANITAEMAFAIGEMAVMVKYYVQAFDWLNYARRLVSRGDTSISMKIIDETKESAIYTHNMDRNHVDDWDNTFYINRISLADANTPKETESWIRLKEAKYNRYKGSTHKDYATINMWALCGNENIQSEKEKAKLKCYLDTKKHPWFSINPLRVEVLAESPLEILLFHDILGDQFANRIVEALDENEKSASSTGDIVLDESVPPLKFFWMTAKRSSATSWIEDTAFPKLKEISEAVTGLISSSGLTFNNTDIDTIPESDMFQAVEYVVGRYYSTHMDVHPAQIETQELRDWTFHNGGIRTATLLFYLNDVEKGGETVFTSARVVAAPKKGSAVFWKSVYKNGTMRTDTSHSSCPILHGRKHVINKWFRSNSQIRTFPCSLNQLE